jgi:hypothetical protein
MGRSGGMLGGKTTMNRPEGRMRLEYEAGTLRVENAEGLRWQLTDVQKPQFLFDYDALSMTDERALKRVGPQLQPLALDEIRQVRSFVEDLKPPSWVTFQSQVTADLRTLSRGLINTVVAQQEYDGLLDVTITGRDGSADLYADEARRVLSYVDSVWNSFHALAAQIQHTPAAELKSLKEYAEMMPFPPPAEHFAGGILQELLSGTPVSR